jgi:DNA-binding response OmpR family regulator
LPASTGTDALRFCRYNRPEIPFLDLDLAEVPGVDVITEVRENDGVESPTSTSSVIGRATVLVSERIGRPAGIAQSPFSAYSTSSMR